MRIDGQTQLKVSENLLTLERGNDELLLANCVDLQPLYVKKGRRYIRHFLEAVSELGTYKKIARAFPYEIDLLDTMLTHNIIVPLTGTQRGKQKKDSFKELDLDRRKTISLYLLLSQSCNMGCIYCLNGTKTYQIDKGLRMSREIAFKSIERCLDNTAINGCLEVIFFGGEPLLNWPLAKEVIVYCESIRRNNHPEKKIKYHLTSNLSLVPKDLIEWATKYNITFLCDVDGPESIHNMSRPFKDGRSSHKTVTKNIKQLVAAGLHVALRATVTALNQDHLLDIAQHHREIGGRSCAFVPVNPINSDEDILPEGLLPTLPKMIKGITDVYRSKVWNIRDLHPFCQYVPRLLPGAKTVLGCGAPYGNTVIVDVNGDVYPCIYFVGIKRFYMGNIMNGSYPNRDLIRWMYSYLHVDHMEDCKLCSWRYICGGGCPLGRLTVSTNPMATDRVRSYCRQISCDYSKSVIELLLWQKAEETASNLIKTFVTDGSPYIEPSIFC